MVVITARSWGPLALTNPQTNAQLSDYSLAAGSQAINYITASGPGSSPVTYLAAPPDDFFGTLRKTNGAVDAVLNHVAEAVANGKVYFNVWVTLMKPG